MIAGIPLTFAQPLLLLGLLSLPVLWWLLRVMPPRPRRIEFPPTRLLFDIAPKEETLGISVEPLSQEDAREPSLRAVARAGGGLAVTSVSPDGPAYQKLLDATAAGGGYPDIILKVNGQPTRSRAEFRAALATVKSGDIVTLTVLGYGPPDGWSQRVVRLRAR